jgi:hypothetical protein
LWIASSTSADIMSFFDCGSRTRLALSLLWEYLPCTLLGDASFGEAKSTIFGRHEDLMCLADHFRRTFSAIDLFYRKVGASLVLADYVPWSCSQLPQALVAGRQSDQPAHWSHARQSKKNKCSFFAKHTYGYYNYIFVLPKPVWLKANKHPAGLSKRTAGRCSRNQLGLRSNPAV